MLGELVAAGVLENRDESKVLTRGIAEKDDLDGKTLEENRRPCGYGGDVAQPEVGHRRA